MKTIKIVALAAMLAVAGTAFAQTAPDLGVRLVAPTAVAVGSQQHVATVQLTAASNDVNVTALPVVVTGSGLANCALRDSTGAAVGTAATAPVHIAGGAVVDLIYRCDVTANGSATIALYPSMIMANANNTAATVGGVPNGNPAATVVLGTGVTPGTGDNGGIDTTTPGIPNTGAGGDGANTWIILTLAALVAAGAGIYAFRRA